jgi:hypothetical protein
LVVLIVTYTFLPALFGNLFGERLKNELDLQAAPEVSLRSESPPAMLAGDFTQGKVSLAQADFGGVRPRRVTIDLDPFDLNVLKSMRDGEFASEEPLSGELRMEIPEKEVARIANSETEDSTIEGVELEEGLVTVESGTRILGVDVPVVVRGGMEIREQQLSFEPRRVSAFGLRLPDGMSEELLSGTNFSYPLEDLPYDANISEIEAKKDYIVLSGRLEDIPLDAESG